MALPRAGRGRGDTDPADAGAHEACRMGQACGGEGPVPRRVFPACFGSLVFRASGAKAGTGATRKAVGVKAPAP